MSARKNAKLILSELEHAELRAFLKTQKIHQQDLADLVGMSKSALAVALRCKRVPRAWFEHLKLKIENDELKSKLQKVNDLTGEKK